MEELQKLFKSKFKQQALDGESKYAKMNLEDSNPDNLPPPLRICALTIAQIKEFRVTLGLRLRIDWFSFGDRRYLLKGRFVYAKLIKGIIPTDQLLIKAALAFFEQASIAHSKSISLDFFLLNLISVFRLLQKFELDSENW